MIDQIWRKEKDTISSVDARGKSARISKRYYTTSNNKRRLLRQLEEKYFDYFVFKMINYICVNCDLLRSRARHRAFAQTIGNARGLDINSSLSMEVHTQDLRFLRHRQHTRKQHGDPNSAQGLDNNFASDRGCDSTTTTRLHLHPRLRLRRTRQKLSFLILYFSLQYFLIWLVLLISIGIILGAWVNLVGFGKLSNGQ
jgi:hypothetical protein